MIVSYAPNWSVIYDYKTSIVQATAWKGLSGTNTQAYRETADTQQKGVWKLMKIKFPRFVPQPGKTKKKHSSLLQTLVNYSRKKLYNVDTRGQCYKTFYYRKLRIFVKQVFASASLSSLVYCKWTWVGAYPRVDTNFGRLLPFPQI